MTFTYNSYPPPRAKSPLQSVAVLDSHDHEFNINTNEKQLYFFYKCKKCGVGARKYSSVIATGDSRKTIINAEFFYIHIDDIMTCEEMMIKNIIE